MFVCGSPGDSILPPPPPQGWGLVLASFMNWCILVHCTWVGGAQKLRAVPLLRHIASFQPAVCGESFNGEGLPVQDRTNQGSFQVRREGQIQAVLSH